MSSSPRAAPAAVLRAFESCGDGTFSCRELKAVLRQLRGLKPGMSDRDIEALLTAIFVEEVGRLHCNVFCDWIFGSRHEASCKDRSAAFSSTFKASDLKCSMKSGVSIPGCDGQYFPDARLERLGEGDRHEEEDESFSELPLPDSGHQSPVSESSRPSEHRRMINATDVSSQQVLMAALHGYSSAEVAEVEMTPRLPCQAGVTVCEELTPRVPCQAGLLPIDEITPRVSPAAGSASLRARPWASRAWGSHMKDASTAAFFSVAQDDNARYRSYMEDGYKVIDPLLRSQGDKDSWGFFAVFDGHGGRQEVAYCESMLHEIVRAEVQHMQSDEDVGRACRTAFEKVDSQLALMGAWSSGCTATVALVHRRGAATTLHVANVGDSRAVLVGGAGSLRLSADHRASDPCEAERVRQEGGVVRNDRVGGQLSVSRSLGDHHLKSRGVSCVPEVRTCSLTGDHALIIASDGLWDALEDCDAGDLLGCCVERAASLHGGDETAVAEHLRTVAAQELVERAKERGSQDNILALVVFF
eukprot:TRINITY_DN42841_c0_g1_i1.p1 TRINITY_DN42841_c0_g1~~TRINITY_DN42841_c0_g1_i1.p1  ORF type:complete len:529 (-),score=86.81 TRINITY_DN42841_c0_g1_i1:164-1750(-)